MEQNYHPQKWFFHREPFFLEEVTLLDFHILYLAHSLEKETFYLKNQNLCLLTNPWLHKLEKCQDFLP